MSDQPPGIPSTVRQPRPEIREFADDAPLWDGFRERCQAVLADIRDPRQGPPLRLFAGLTLLLLFCYWPGLAHASTSWSTAQYSHGWFVPLFAAAMLFWRRQPIDSVSPSARTLGLLVLVASLALRLFVARYQIITIDMYSFVPALGGVALLAGGWSAFRWAWAPIAFLLFMYPLPDEATRYLLAPLQTIATVVSTYAIQTTGIDAVREGNQIVVGERLLGVVDACSGLRMLTIFIALSVAIVMMGKMAWYEGLVVIASAIPIALAVNAIRITVTGIMYTIDPELAEKIFHDWAGYFMMPMALGMLFMVRQLLTNMVTMDDVSLARVAPSAPIWRSGAVRPPAGRRAAAAPLIVRPLGISKRDATAPGGRRGSDSRPETL